jgi:O-antigen ligase
MGEKIERSLTLLVLFLGAGAFAPFLDPDTGDFSQGATAAAGTFNTAMWLGLYFLVMILVIFQIRQFARAAASDLLLAALLVYLAVSVRWSLTPGSSALYAASLLCTSAVGYYLALRYTLKEQTTYIAIALAACLILCVVFAVLDPGIAFMALYGGALRGIFAHKNVLSRMSVLGAVLFFYLGKHSEGKIKLAWYSLIPLALALLVASKSAGGIVVGAGMVGVGVAVWVLRRATRGALALGFCALGVGFIVAILLYAYLPLVFKALGRDPSLTGRLPLWIMVLAAWSKQPWLGYGYGGFWRSNYASDMAATIKWDAPQAHNGFLNILIELGAVGLVIFLAGSLRAYWRAIRLVQDQEVEFAPIPLIILSFLILFNFDEQAYLIRNNITWMIYVSCVCMLSKSYQHERVSESAPSPAFNTG